MVLVEVITSFLVGLTRVITGNVIARVVSVQEVRSQHTARKIFVVIRINHINLRTILWICTLT